MKHSIVICGFLLLASGSALAQSEEQRLNAQDAVQLEQAASGQPMSPALAEDLSALFRFDARFVRTHVGARGTTATQFINSSGAGRTLSQASLLSASNINAAPAVVTQAATVDENSLRITSIPFTISQPGAYRLADNLTNSTADADGITISVSDVTLDLGGFVLSGGDPDSVSGDGIVVLSKGDPAESPQTGIRILNGHVTGWGGDGINADNCDSCLFEDLSVSRNTQNGLVTGAISTVRQVIANFNGLDGIDVSRGSVVSLSTARENGDSGIQGSSGVVITQSGSFANSVHGIDVGAGASIANATTRDNLRYGFELGAASIALQSSAFDNGENGFYGFFAAMMRDNTAARNGSETDLESGNNGFRAGANSYLINNYALDNDGAGIRSVSFDSLIEGNVVVDNDRVGIEVTASGNIILRNRASGNASLDSPLNYDIPNDSAFGPIIDVSEISDISSVTNADHSAANLSY